MIAIIPARSGSTHLKDKNLKKINKKPLIYYSILTALRSKHISKCIVTTDSKKIAKIAKYYGAEAPFLRPKKISSKNSLSIDAYLHAINSLEKNTKKKVDNFIVLQPTSPIRSIKIIDKAIKLYSRKKIKFMISVGEIISKKYVFETNKNLMIKKRSVSLINRQNLKKTFYPNGNFFIINTKELLKKRTFYTNKTYLYKIPKHLSFDIDDKEDFDLVKKIIEKNYDFKI